MNEDLKYQEYLSNGGTLPYGEYISAASLLSNIDSPDEDLKKKDQTTENGNPTLTNGTQPSETDLPILPNPIPESEFLVPIGSEQDLISPSLDSTAQTPSTDLPLTNMVSSGIENSNLATPQITNPALNNVGDLGLKPNIVTPNVNLNNFTTQNINPFARDLYSPFQIGGTNLSKAESTLEVLAGKPNEGEENIITEPTAPPVISEQENKESKEFFDKYLNKDYIAKIPPVKKGVELTSWSKTPEEVAKSNQLVLDIEKTGDAIITKDENGNAVTDENGNYKYTILTDSYEDTFNNYINEINKETRSENIDSARFNQGNIGNTPPITPDQEYIAELSKNGVLLDISDFEKVTNQEDRNEFLATAEASFNAKKNGTTFQEEYDKSITKYNIPDDVKIANGFEASNLLLGNSKWDDAKDKAEIELFENFFKDVNNVKDFGEYWNNEGKAKFGSSWIKENQVQDQVVRATVWNDYLSYKNDKLNTNITFTDTAVQQANNRLENYLKNGDIESAMAEEAKINGFINQYNQNENEKQKLSLFAEESNKSFTEYNKLKEQEAEFQRKVENGEISANAQNILGQVVLGVESSLKSAVGGVARFVSVPFGEGNVKDAVDIFSNTELKIGNVKIAPLSQKVVEFEGFDGKKYKEVNGVTYQIGKDGELLKTTKKRQDSDKVLNEDTEYNWSGLTFMASKAITDIYITRGIEGGINRAIAGTAERIAVSKNIASVFGEGSQLAKASASFARLPRNASGASIKGWTVQMFNDSYQAGERGGIKGDVNKFIYALTIAGVQAQLQRINPDINFLKAINNDTQQIVRHLMTNNTQKALQTLKGVATKMGNNVAGELPEEASQQGYQDIVNLLINNNSNTNLEVTDKQGYKDLAVGTIGTSILLSLAGGGNSNVVNVNNKEIDLSNYSRNDLVTEIARDKNGLDILKNFKNESYFQSQKDFATELENEISTRSKLISKIPEVEQYSTSALSEVAPILQIIEKKKEDLKNDDGTFTERIKNNIESLTVQANAILDNDLTPNNESPNAETAQPTPQSEAVQEQAAEAKQPQVTSQSEQPTITGEQNVPSELNPTNNGQATAEIESTKSEVEEIGQGSQTEGNNATNQLPEMVEGDTEPENVTQEVAPQEEINEDDIVLADDIFDLINSVEDDTQTTNNITVDGNTESSVSVIQQDEQGGQENTQTVSETTDVGRSEGDVEVNPTIVEQRDAVLKTYQDQVQTFLDEKGITRQEYESLPINERKVYDDEFLNSDRNKNWEQSKESKQLKDLNHKISQAKIWSNGVAQGQIENGRITATEAKARIEEYGIPVPKDILEKAEQETQSENTTNETTNPATRQETQSQSIEEQTNITTPDGKDFYQKSDGNWYGTNPKGVESKVTRKNRITELDNLNKEKNVTLTKEKNGFTYKKYKDGSEEIVSSKGKIITSKIERRRNGKLRIENNPQFANQKKNIFGEKSDNEIKIEDAKRRKEALMNFTPTNELEVAMLYFANGGKVSSASVNSEIVGNSEILEARGKKRRSIKDYKWVWLGKNANLTFSEVSEKLVGDEIQEFDQPTLRSELIEVARSYGSSTEIAEEIVDLYNKSTDPYYGFTDEDAIAMQEAEASKAKMDFYNSVGDVYGLTDEELLDYYKQQYENSINNLTDEQQNELYTADTRTDSAQQSDKNAGNGNRVSEKQGEKATTTSPEYQQLLKDRTAQEARVKSAKEKLDKVNKTTNTDFQADQENLFGDRATTDANALFDERANGNAGQEVIAKAKSEYDQARAELTRINNAIRDFENGNASGTGAIDFLFYGEKGAIQYANNEIDNLVKARIYEEQGKTPKEILDATGWFKGAEGKWRKETNHKFKFTFPDFKLGGGDVKRVKLKDVLDYPQLFKLYPRLENINLVFKNINSENYADTNGFNTITVYTDGGGISTASGNKFAHTTGAIIHEIQHLIQSDERFASGYFEGVATELLSPRFSGSGMENPLSLPLAEYERMVEKRFGKEWRNEYESGRIKSKQIGDYLYENTAGEIEAFNAQRRSQLTEEELRNELPKLLGVNPDELIKSISPVSNFFFKKPFTPIPQSTYDKLVKRLLGVFKKFGGKVITTKSEVDAKLKEFGVDSMDKMTIRFDIDSILTALEDYLLDIENEISFNKGEFLLNGNVINEEVNNTLLELFTDSELKDINKSIVLKKISDVKIEPTQIESDINDLNIEDFQKHLLNKYPSLKTLLLSSDGDTLFLDMIEVNDGSRKKGLGSSVINEIVDYANYNKIEIELIPAQKDELHGTTSRSRLVKFYKRFGFVENKGRNRDFSRRSGSMFKGVEFMKTKDGEIYGAKFPDGTIYLNPEKVNANTPIHEFSHLWQQLMPARFKKGVELLKNTPIGKKTFAELKANEGYANKSDEELWNEAMVAVMGNEGERIFNSSRTSKLKEWLTDLFKALGNAFGIRDLSPNDKLSTFVKGALSEVMGTKEIIPESSVEQKEVPIYIRKMSNTDLRGMLDKLGLVMDAVCPN